MSNIIRRSTVAFVKEESTEGLPVAPAAATDAVSLLDAFAMAPAIEQIKTTLLRNSIDEAKTITGVEKPTASMPQYLKGSGVEGQAPEWHLFAKATLGSEYVATVEYATGATNTETVLHVVGASTNLKLGQPLLIKDPVNGFRIRHVDSFPDADHVALSFQVPTGQAPGTGVTLGKAVTWIGVSTGHPSLALWLYLGNPGLIEVAAGLRPSTMTIDATAGKPITMDFALEGIGFFWDPTQVTSGSRYLDFTDDDGTFAVAVAAKFYKTPHDLAEALQSAMNASGTTKVHSVKYSNVDGKYRFTATGTVLSLLFNTGTNSANTIAPKIGYSAAADSTGNSASVGYASATALDTTAPYTPTYDATDANIAKNQEFMVGDATDYSCFNPSSVKTTVTDTKAIQTSICAESGQVGSTMTGRQVTMDVTALLQKYDADKIARHLSNKTTRAQYSWGEKSGGNWVPGKSGGIYLSSATVSKLDTPDLDGFVSLQFTLSGFVGSAGGFVFAMGQT